MVAKRSGAVLAADFGSVNTRVVLFDLVDGVYRLIARGDGRTTVGYPVNDVSVGLDRALQQLSATTGRTFLNSEGHVITPEQPDASGVDYFITTASAGRPLRAVLVGLVPEFSIASALKAISGVYVHTQEIIDIEDGRNEEERLNAILLARPDLIFISGGLEAGAADAVLDLARLVRLAAVLTDKQLKPAIVYAGNSSIAGEIEAMFEDVAPLYVAGNIRPSMAEEEFEDARHKLGLVFDEYKEKRGEAFAAVSEMSTSGVLPTAQGYSLIVEFLGKVRDGDVLAVDFGSGAAMAAASLNGEVRTTIDTDLGLGHSAPTLLETVGEDYALRWLPFNPLPGELLNYTLNKALRPASVPNNLRELYIEHALLREGLYTVVHDVNPAWGETLPPLDLIIAAGAGLSGVGHPAYTAMLILDALQPTGVTELWADPYGIMPALGALAMFNPEAVVHILDDRTLDVLGTSISLSGRPDVDKPAMRIRLKRADGEEQAFDLDGGRLWVYPLETGESVEVNVLVAPGLHIGGKRRIKGRMTGGTAGLIFDARGRALPLADDVAGLAEQLPLWVSDVTDDAPRAIPQKWLEEAAAPAEDEMEIDVEELAPEEEEFMDLIDEESDEADEDELGALRDVLS